MKKNRNLIFLVILLGGLTAYFTVQHGNSTVREELKDFAVKDTAAITKIFLADRSNHAVTIEKKNGRWLVNDKYKPRKDVLKDLMDVLYLVNVRTKVSKAAYNNVIKNLAAASVKCEIYLNGETKPFKTYYVGGQTEDALGTFMMLDQSSVPFITQIPGFNGYLTPRYCVSEDIWRENSLFTYKPGEIKKISVDYANFPQKSFAIEINNGIKTVTTPDEKNSLSQADTTAINNYVELFSGVYYEAIERTLSKFSIDSIINLPPPISIRIEDQNKKESEVRIYPMPLSHASLSKIDSTGAPLKYDVDRMYGYSLPSKEMLILQHYNFDRVLRQLDDFRIKSNGKAAPRRK